MEKDEFTKLFTKYHAKFFGSAIKLTRSQEDANDLMQETLYKAYKNLPSFKTGSNFSAWVSTIMRNTFINDYRIQKRNYSLTGKISENRDNIMPQSTNNQGESNQIVTELMTLINELKEETKVPFLLHYAGYQYDEIANQLEIPIGTIKSRIFFARKDLKASIKKRYKVGHYSEILN